MTSTLNAPQSLAQLLASKGIAALAHSATSDQDLEHIASIVERERESERAPRKAGRPTSISPSKRTAVKGIRLEEETWTDLQSTANVLMKSVNRCVEEAVFAYLANHFSRISLPEIPSLDKWIFASSCDAYPTDEGLESITFELDKVG